MYWDCSVSGEGLRFPVELLQLRVQGLEFRLRIQASEFKV